MNKRKKAVIDHALRLFVEHGIAKTSIQQIIERAGISKGTFYNYFSSKTECIEAILEQARYDASLLRAELMIGKDPTDINVFANQIAVLWKINQGIRIGCAIRRNFAFRGRRIKRTGFASSDIGV